MAARLDDIAHQNREHFIGIDGVIIVYVYFQELAFLRIHRGLEQLFGVHLAEALEALDLDPAPANLQNLLKNFGNRKERMRDGLFAFAFDQLEDRPVAGSVMGNFEALAGELGNQFLDRSGLV